MSSSLSAAKQPSGILLSSPAFTVPSGLIVTTTGSGQVAPMASGPASMSNEDRIPNEWWICTDWPGPPETDTWELEVTAYNWRNFSNYHSAPTKYNVSAGKLRDIFGNVLGDIVEVEVVHNFILGSFSHVYTLTEAEE